MAPPLFVYIPAPAVVRAPNTPSTPIIITSNNVAFSPFIPEKLRGQGLEDFMRFLQAHPLRYALCDVPDPFLPQHICEFYYSCHFNPVTRTIHGTIAAGTQNITITPSTIRNALRLPIFHEYPDNPSEAECKDSLPLIGYNIALQGTRNEKFVLRQCLPAGWKLLTGVIGKCLGQKTGSLDQLNLFELRILHAFVANRMYDFAGLIFDHFVETISGKSRPPYVTFPRFIGLFLQHLGEGYVGEPEDELPCPSMSPRMFSSAPQEGDPHLTNSMLNWIAHPYSADPHLVNFVSILVEPLQQQPGDIPQSVGEAHPQPTDDTQLTDESSSSSSQDRQSPLHHSPAETPSGNTASVHLTQSEGVTPVKFPFVKVKQL